MFKSCLWTFFTFFNPAFNLASLRWCFREKKIRAFCLVFLFQLPNMGLGEGIGEIVSVQKVSASENLLPKNSPAKPFHVILDPGHGGPDSGAKVYWRGMAVLEKHLVLKIAEKIKEELQRHPQIQVTLTRESDEPLSLADRVRIADQSEAEVFLSLHLNSSRDPRARGIEFYIENQLPPSQDIFRLAEIEYRSFATELRDTRSLTTPERIIEDLERQSKISQSYLLARSLQEHYPFRVKSHAIRQAPFFVNLYNQVPSVLIEIGYLTHPRELELLKDSTHQQQVAKGLAQGVVVFLSEQSNSAPGRPFRFSF